ncbi:hypothetical protein CONCODRAFT_79978 [Conidiobolus coronatus NRRL 28638]|uniref:Zn(2)-C6 fungal-type domain-containing protein n=1 Tax=Conidiobolus coronatus (strain ATCC 28846 / CBS 209.66 / NRRL 28638) TaxID=796925 RepID=A0A137NYF9_CONC2|nr:hypothetical protein CONCODRAFT_79978 [Conidiobolus coronatus NRRL 28638]|eukprot:KXN67903.1 hypothetical protein CONCODRAFT_79978 [Conidiobolus coronatus NRRL 28638]
MNQIRPAGKYSEHTNQACDSCRKKKVKCVSNPVPGLPCGHCNKHRYTCTYYHHANKRGPKGTSNIRTGGIRKNQNLPILTSPLRLGFAHNNGHINATPNSGELSPSGHSSATPKSDLKIIQYSPVQPPHPVTTCHSPAITSPSDYTSSVFESSPHALSYQDLLRCYGQDINDKLGYDFCSARLRWWKTIMN